MKEAGYSESNKCPVTLLTTGHTAWVATVQALKENLDACYFDVSISQTQDFTPYYGGQFDICIVGMAMGRMFNFFSQLWDPATGINFCYYDGPDLQEIIDGFQTAQDQESANAVILKQDATFCYVPLAYDACLAAFDDQLDTSEAWSGAGYDFSRIKWK